MSKIKKKECFPPKVWNVAVLLQGVIALSAYVAMRLGHQDEHIVEKMVREGAMERHEEWGEVFVWASVALFGILFLSALLKKIKFLKLLAIFGSLFTLVIVALTGHAGGQLVYQEGAAAAQVQKFKGGGQLSPSEVDGTAGHSHEHVDE